VVLDQLMGVDHEKTRKVREKIGENCEKPKKFLHSEKARKSSPSQLLLPKSNDGLCKQMCIHIVSH